MLSKCAKRLNHSITSYTFSSKIFNSSLRNFTISNPKVSAFEQAVGNTPLLYLKSASEAAGCQVYGKAEFMNPGGSIKDRAALWMIREAISKGELIPGEPGIIVEGTAGNTGIGLGIAGPAFGYETIIVIPKTQTQEKKDQLKYAGSKLVEVDAAPYKNINHYVKIAERLATNIKNKGKRVLYANQWDNLANQNAHIEATGPEIWEQTQGKIDVFSCAVGTGGTLTGVSKYLKSKNPNIKICLTDPKGACIYRYFEEGELRSEGSSISEGIGQGRLTGQLLHENFRPDDQIEVDDIEMLEVLQDIQRKDGLMTGLSTGINVAGAIQIAKKLRLTKDQIIVTVLCDLGSRYATKQYNVEFLKSQGLPYPEWLEKDPLENGNNGYAKNDSPIAVNPFIGDNLMTECLLNAVARE